MKEFLHSKEMELIDKNKCKYRIGIAGEVIMTLPTGVKRQIGQLTKIDADGVDRLIYTCYRKKAIHLMRVNNSYGVNEYIINQFKPDEIVFIVEDTGEKLWIDAASFAQNSAYLHFKNSGFELQRFIGLNHLKTIEVW